MPSGPLYTKRLWLTLLLLLVLPLQLPAASLSPEEVKASYLLQLRKFVKVGNPAHVIRQICYYEKPGVDASESVGQILSKYLQKSPVGAGDTLSVKWFQAIRDFSTCDVFFIPADEEGNIDAILAKLGSSSTLTVSAAKRFIFRGGMIGFVLDDANHVRMEGNLTNMRANSVYVDAQVLELMQQVVGK